MAKRRMGLSLPFASAQPSRKGNGRTRTPRQNRAQRPSLPPPRGRA
jgi:hypothetical protein